MLAELFIGDGYQFKTTPLHRQLVGLYLGLMYKRFAFFYGMGGGKTWLGLNLAQALASERKILILAPSESVQVEWTLQAQQHSHLSIDALRGSSVDKWGTIDLDRHDGYVATYAGFYSMLCGVDVAKGKLKPVPALVRKAQKLFGGLILDEVHKTKTKQTLTFRVINQISKQAEYVFSFSGTPMQQPEDLWAQMFLTDRGATLGTTLGMFRSALFTASDGWGGSVKWTFDNRKLSKLHVMLKHRSIHYSEEEIDSTLPSPIEKRHRVLMTKEQKTYYAPANKKFIAGFLKAKELESTFHTMRQVCSGFVQWNEDKKATSIRLLECPKLDLVARLLQEHDEKMIIFHFFKESGRMLADICKQYKKGFAVLSGLNTKNKTEHVRRFKEDPDCKIMIANIVTASHGGNYQMAKHIVFYDLPTSTIDYQQCIKRSWRTGQTDRVYLHYPLCIGTFEEERLQALIDGRDFMAEVLAGKFRGKHARYSTDSE